MSSLALEGKSALITGASRGIGKAIALRFAAEGCDIAVNYVTEAGRDNAAEAAQTAEEIGGLGRQALCVEADVTDFGKLDILVNNAGITRDRTLKKLAKEDWDSVIAVNLTGAFHCARAVIEHMRERQYGRIISISSVIAQMGNIGQKIPRPRGGAAWDYRQRHRSGVHCYGDDASHSARHHGPNCADNPDGIFGAAGGRC